jgi:acylphosphatase
VSDERARILVSGVVQGVGYRYFAERAANSLGLKGFCRNLPNGTVEVVVEGDRGLIIDYVRELGRGPAAASVSATDISWERYVGEFNNFGIRFY